MAYTAILYLDLTWEFVAEIVANKAAYARGARFFAVPVETTVETFVTWIDLGMPAGELIEY